MLWKLGEKPRAEEIVIPMLDDYSGNLDLLQLGAVVYLDKAKLKKTKALLRRIEDALGPQDRRVKELKYAVFLQEGRWNEASGILKELIKQAPKDMALRRDYAFSLSAAGRWPQAKEQLGVLISQGERSKNTLWDYHNAVNRGSDGFFSQFEYLHGPQSLRHYITTEGARFWLKPELAATFGAVQETLRVRALGDTPGISKQIYGNILKFDYAGIDSLQVSGQWQPVYMSGKTFNEEGFSLIYAKNNLRSILGYDFNHLVRDPIQGLDKQGRLNHLEFSNDLTFFDRLTLGNIYEVDWYRLKGEENRINGKKSLGYKIFSDIYFNTLILRDPYFSFNFHYKYTHWKKNFEGAEQVIDYIGDEKIYYGGIYLEKRIGKTWQVTGSFSRAYDAKRKFYYSLSNVAVEAWVKDGLKSSLAYEYDYDINGTTGAGNSGTVTARLDWFF